MRQALPIVGVVTLLLSGPVFAQAPEKPKFLVKIDQVRVGFRAYNPNDGTGQFKVGMWTPVYVDVIAGTKGVTVKDPASHLEFESTDSEGVGTYYRIPMTSMEPNEVRTFVGYTKPGNYETASKVGVTLRWDDRSFNAPPQLGGPLGDLGSHLYLSLGSRIPDLREALISLKIGENQNVPLPEFDNRDTAPRYAAFETDPARLPEHWFGYQSVDLMVLNTDNKEFLLALKNDANQLRLGAIAQWVRRGGRLIIPVNHLTQGLLVPVLLAPAWQPMIPVVPPANPGDVKQAALKRLEAVERWAHTAGQAVPRAGRKGGADRQA